MQTRARYLNRTFTGIPFAFLNTTYFSGVGKDPYAIPANAIRDRAGNPILSRSGDYIVTRA